MDTFESLSHSVWEQIPRGVHSEVPAPDLVWHVAPHLGEVFRKLAVQKESRIEEGHLLPDHVHMMIAIPPRFGRGFAGSKPR